MILDAISHIPKYVQIADILRQRIARGVWSRGMRPNDEFYLMGRLPKK